MGVPRRISAEWDPLDGSFGGDHGCVSGGGPLDGDA
jgi:hypothetical protein